MDDQGQAHDDSLQATKAAGRVIALKDVSDWIKIILLAGMAFMGYQALRDQVAQHTHQLDDLDGNLRSLQSDELKHHQQLERALGKMNLYLCSRDAKYCKDLTE